MRKFDFSPLYRSAIGFDHIINLLDSATRVDQGQPSYPPYNIEQLDDDRYRITMAVAGFTQQELSIVSEQNTLLITGKKAEEKEQRHFLHQGIAARSFERRFQLADHIQVVNASLENGLLHVELVREIPEAMKPKHIPIDANNMDSNLIEQNG